MVKNKSLDHLLRRRWQIKVSVRAFKTGVWSLPGSCSSFTSPPHLSLALSLLKLPWWVNISERHHPHQLTPSDITADPTAPVT